MSWKDLTSEDRAELLKLKSKGVPLAELSDRCGINILTLDRRLRELSASSRKKETVIPRPTIKYQVWDEPPVFSGDATIIGDLHLPYLDYQFADEMLIESREVLAPPRRLIICGDLFNLDSFSTYAPVSPGSISLRHEIASGKNFLKAALGIFDTVDITLGNHDRRVIYRTLGQISDVELRSLIGCDNVNFYLYGHAILQTKRGEWRCTHQASYSTNSQSVGVKLAHKFGQHIITHHQHKVSVGFDSSGRYVVIDNGMMASPSLIDYANVVDNTLPAFKQSYVIIKEGKARLYTNNEPLA